MGLIFEWREEGMGKQWEKKGLLRDGDQGCNESLNLVVV